VNEPKDKPVLIYGSGRSGTTWVQDVLAKANRYGTLFEPLHPDAVRGTQELANLYIEAGTRHAALSRFMNSVLDGTLNSLWAAVRVRPDRLLPPARVLATRKGASEMVRGGGRVIKRWIAAREYRGRPRIIKFIRANLMMEWMQAEYGLRSAVVVRHPCAVLASVCQRSDSEEWAYPAIKTLLSRYLEQAPLAEGRLKDKMPALRSLNSMAEVHAATWCIENAHLVASDGSKEIPLVCYEHLTGCEESVWRKLADTLCLERVPGEELLRRPSQQAGYARLKNEPESQGVAGWQSYLTDEQKADVKSVLNLFDVDSYDVEDPLPSGHLASSGRL
jgi:hypothetical protein